MKKFFFYIPFSRIFTLTFGVIVCIIGVLSGCELLCQAGSGTCGLSKEQADKLLNPKAYGEYWTKPGMTKDSWRQDWVECGGKQNGQYVAGPRLPGETNDIAASARTANLLASCMKSKGYTYHYTGI